jgi:NAD(P)-dependent dehydrogenase (short-subunit alcohol dehydrogenase family)
MAVLVAGGTGALGGAVLRELAESGYDVTATWLVEKEAERIESELGDAVRLLQANLLDSDGAAGAVAAVDGLEAVVNLVGGFSDGPKAHETDPADFMKMIELNVLPAFLLARAAMPVLSERDGGGAFVAVSARAALRPFPGAAGYITGKAAVLALVQALDAEYKGAGVRCNAVLPSVIDTPANRTATPGADFERWVQPAEIAKVIRFLVSDESGPVSGAGVPVYGRA